MTFDQALQSWHDFYLTAGAASATLVGLLFVGLSLHIRVVVSHPDVRALARVTLTNFFVIVLIALAILIPTTASTNIALWLLLVGLVSFGLMLRPAIEGFRNRSNRTLGLRVLTARFGISALGFIAMIGLAAVFAAGNYEAGFNGLVTVVVVLLVMAVRNTWDLLVTVADKTAGPTEP
jgi:hypothetical protein